MLLDANSTPGARRHRLWLFVLWLALVGWLLATHVFWRDEVRAFSLALSGQNVFEMLSNIHGEGHPALWYLVLRLSHDILPVREVLPAAGAVIGIAAMGLFVFRAPFRLPILALALFSLFGAFEYVVVARNYGVSALLMFALAALNPRIRNTPWFGFILAVLCNTNVPSCILAAAFLLFRLVEIIDEKAPRREWLMFAVNAAIAATGAAICFATVYPTPNGAALSSNFGSIGPAALVRALVDWRSGFSSLTLNGGGPAGAILLLLICLLFVRKPAALAATLSAFFALKLFFYIVYPSSYRHEALFVVFLLSLLWMVEEGGGGAWREAPWMEGARSTGAVSFLVVLAFQSLDLAKPLYLNATGVPFSRSAEVAELLRDKGLSQAMVMADPDTMLEPLTYYANNPLWFSRTHSFGRVVPLSGGGRRELSLDDVVADADRLHRDSGRQVVFLSHLELQDLRPERRLMMYDLTTSTTPESVRRVRAATRLIARLRPAVTDEAYDVYVYPR